MRYRGAFPLTLEKFNCGNWCADGRPSKIRSTLILMSMNELSVTTLLQDWRQGRSGALDRLMPLVYDSLKKIAKRRRAGEHGVNTFDTTEIVHQAYIQLVDADVDWQNRAHFYAIASQVMRRVLIDQARARKRQKRGGDEQRVTYDESLARIPDLDADLLDLDRALSKLATQDERKARILECHFFAGMTYDEIAECLSISAATVDRDLRFAKAWVYREISADSENTAG